MELSPRFPEEVWDGLSVNNERPNRTVDQSPDGEDWDRITAEVIALQEHALGQNALGVAETNITATENQAGAPVHQTTLTLSGVSMQMTDADTAGCHGGAQLYNFPAGNILILGAVMDLAIVAGSGGLADDAAVVAAIGTDGWGVDNETLTDAEANIVPSTAATLAAGAGVSEGCFNDSTDCGIRWNGHPEGRVAEFCRPGCWGHRKRHTHRHWHCDNHLDQSRRQVVVACAKGHEPMDITKEAVSEFHTGSGTVGTSAAQLHTGMAITKYVVVKAAGDLGSKTIHVGPTLAQASSGFVLRAGEQTPPIHVNDLGKVWLVGSDADCDYSWVAV